ncbi:MAG: A24 family peptidase [Thermomicrobiales bacterium]
MQLSDLMHVDLHIAQIVLLLVVVAAACFTDIRERRIPNAITVPAMVAGLALNFYLDWPRGGLMSLIGWVLGIALYLIPFFLGYGAGDLKLVAALGAIGGPAFVVWCVLFTLIVGFFSALVTLVKERQLGTVAGGIALDVVTRQKIQANSGIRQPHAISIAIGAIAAILLR